MQPDRTALLTRLMRERILVLDGAMGTMIQCRHLAETDYRGECLAAHAQPHQQSEAGDGDRGTDAGGALHRAPPGWLLAGFIRGS